MMKILCDTHIYFWWVTGDAKLPLGARKALEDRANDVFVSAVVAWELATKNRLGKWPSARVVLDQMDETVEAKDLKPLPITSAHATLAGLFPAPHQDPFDRMLAAQAEVEGMVLATVDARFREFRVRVLS
jgi:PIN domain nuclease of toxin-antitoxin system